MLDHTQRVEAEGDLRRRIFFIGEAPAAIELRQHRPFVGPAGEQQNLMNTRASIQRDDARWSNISKIRMPADEISYFIDLQKRPDYEHFLSWVNEQTLEPPRGINPECFTHIKELFFEVDHFQGNVIVPLGNVPMWVLTGHTKISSHRGSILSARGHKIIPCVHPSSVLRSFSLIEKKLAILDLQRVEEESHSPKIVLPERNLRTYPTLEEALAYIEAANSLPAVGFDIECMRCADTSLEMSCFSIAHTGWDAMSIPLTTQGHSYFTEAEEMLVLDALATLGANPKVRKRGHNIIFDASFLYRTHGILLDPLDDTMLAHTIRFPDLKWKISKKAGEIGQAKGIVGLDFITRFWTREPYYKDEGKEWENTGGSREKAFFEYNAKDSAIVMEAFPKIIQSIEEQDAGRTEDM